VCVCVCVCASVCSSFPICFKSSFLNFPFVSLLYCESYYKSITEPMKRNTTNSESVPNVFLQYKSFVFAGTLSVSCSWVSSYFMYEFAQTLEVHVP